MSKTTLSFADGAHEKAVIVVSSLVSGSRVGGAVSVQALSHAGFRAELVPTVIMGRHPGLGAPGGGSVPDALFAGVLEGMTANGRRRRAGAILTGYFATPAQVKTAAAFIRAARAENPDLLVMTDPIIGDGRPDGGDAGLYVAPETAFAICDLLLPLANVITPNLFELSWLAGRALESWRDAAGAARALAPAALVTSAPAGPGRIGVLYVDAQDALTMDTRQLDSAPNGTGDLFAASALAEALQGAAWPEAARRAAARVALVLEAGRGGASGDLLLTPRTLGAPVTLPRLTRPGATRPAWAMGLDGCKAGWAAVMVDMNGLEAPRTALFATLREALDTGAQIIAVDMPVGLADGPDGRGCEPAVRRILGARRASLFTPPLRPALAARDYQEALALNRAAGGPGLSVQCWNLFAKLREVDEALTPALQSCVFEAHPETSFAVISGAPALHTKKTRPGREERLALLAREGLETALFEPHPFARSLAAPDDLVDAGLCALTALRIAAGQSVCFPETPDHDARGLRMAIHA